MNRAFIFRMIIGLSLIAGPGITNYLPAKSSSASKSMHLCIRIPSSISAPDFDTEFGGAMIKTGIDYLRSVSSAILDIIHVDGDPIVGSDIDYDCVVQLVFEQMKGEDLKLREAYRIKTISKGPEVIEIKSGSARGLLYGLYRLGGILESHQSLLELDIKSQPMVSHRVAMLSPTSGFGKHFQPDMFWRSLREFPGLGLNGVFILPAKTHGTPAGMSPLPFRLSGSQVVAIEPEASELREVFRKIKAHGQDVYVLVSPILPPGFSPEEVRAYYDGKMKLEGYESAVTESMTAYMRTLFQTMPEIDGVVFHSLELGELWEGVSIFPCKDMSAGIRTLDAYLAAITNTCESSGKLPIFWTHVYGLNGSELLQIRQALLGRDDLITLEDAYWPNGGWPFLPFMGYLPEDTREQVCRTTRLGIFLETTDGEYYGGGKLPIAWPERHIEAVGKAIENNAEMVFLRLNEHDETTHGTLFSTNAVMVEAAALNLWNPAPILEDIWLDSYVRLFGAAAAPQVVKAFKQSETILRDGFTVGDYLLLDHEGISPSAWLPGRTLFNLFQKPGTPLVSENYHELDGMNLLLWQSRTRLGTGIAIDVTEFRERNAAAHKAAAQGFAEIEAARSALTDIQFEELTRCFKDAQITLKAIGLLGEAAYRANILADNYSGEKGDPREMLNKAIDDLRNYADEVEKERGLDFMSVHYFIKFQWQGKTIAGPSMPVTLRYYADKLTIK